LNEQVFNLSKAKPTLHKKNRDFYVKNISIPLTEYTAVNTFCGNIRDEINIFICGTAQTYNQKDSGS